MCKNRRAIYNKIADCCVCTFYIISHCLVAVNVLNFSLKYGNIIVKIIIGGEKQCVTLF